MSIAMDAQDYEAVIAFKNEWGVSISEYFRALHRRYYKEVVEGVKEAIRFSGIVSSQAKGPELPGMKSFFVPEESFEDFERMRTLTANYEGLSGFSRQAMFNTLLEVYHDFVKQRYGNRAPVIPDIDPDTEPLVDKHAEDTTNGDFDDWENL